MTVQLGAHLGFFVLVACSTCCAQPFNLLIIQTDEHNFRTLGCYRELMTEDQAFVWGKQAVVETPHIDAIAHRGAICTSFYATSPVCTPSRAALLTGRFPQNTGAIANNLPLRDDVRTFAQRLQEHGYATGYAGKWHLDGDGKPQWEPRRNFGFADNRFMFNRGHWKHLELLATGPQVGAHDAKGQPSYALDGADSKTFTTDWLCDRTIDFIRAHRDGPFCYMVSIPDPHGPNTVRPPYDEMFDPDVFERPRTFDQTKDQTPAYLGNSQLSRYSPTGMAKYFGMVKCIDDNVGRLLACLDEFQIRQQTVVVFTSDHGDLCGEHHRDNKGNPYEASARVPFLIAFPGRIPAGTVLHPAMSGIDFQPTIMTLLGLAEPGQVLEGVEGRDLSSMFLTGSVPAEHEDVIFVRRAGAEPGWVAAISDRYKLVISPQDEPWLFDMQVNPDELINYYDAPEYASQVAKLAALLAAYGPAHQDPSLRHPKLVADLAEARAKQ